MEAAEKNAHSFKGTEVLFRKYDSATPSATVCRQKTQQFQEILAIVVARRIIQQQIVALKMLSVIIAKRRVIW